MSAADLTTEVLEPIRQAVVASGELNLLVGAGASVGAGLPSWNEFTLTLIELSKVAPSREDAAAFLSAQDLLLALEAARSASRRPSTWIARLRRALYGPSKNPKVPTTTHIAIADLIANPPDGLTTVNCATLNYDTLIEDALRDIGIKAHSVVGAEPVSSGEPVRHLHGVLTETGASEEVILTLTDYLGLIGQSTPWQSHVLQSYRYSGPLLMIGTSYSDMDIRHWFQQHKCSISAAKPALNILSREGLKLSKKQFAAVQPALERQWSALGITVVPVHDHADAAQILRELPSLNIPGYVAPAERVKRIYATHTGTAFDDVQSAYACHLTNDHTAAEALVGDYANATLWLADGTGALLRWATGGRIYQDERQLRRVAADHDSPWAVAQSYCRNGTTVWRDEERDPDGPSRWCTVVATPVSVMLGGGPATPCGVLTVASSNVLTNDDVEQLVALCVDAAKQWSIRVADTVAAS